MKVNNINCKCGNDDFYVIKRESQVGAYCKYCGKWIKWLNKNENKLAQFQGRIEPMDYIVEDK